MTALAEPAPLDPGSRLFEYDLDDLAEVGVRLPIEQQQLLDQCIDGGEQWAMSLRPLVDVGDRYRMTQPELCWDPDLRTIRIVTWPIMVLLDWSEMSNTDEDGRSVFSQTLARERNWRRFPSLPGRPRRDMWWGDDSLGEYESFRIWDLWPMNAVDIDTVEEAAMRWMENEPFSLIDIYKSVQSGDFDYCDLAQHLGHGEESAHQHQRHDPRYSYEHCITGENALAELEHQIYVPIDPEGDDSTWAMKWFPGPQLPPPYEAWWDSLLASSEANAMRAINIFPPWERDALIDSERWYSPWLWLC